MDYMKATVKLLGMVKLCQVGAIERILNTKCIIKMKKRKASIRLYCLLGFRQDRHYASKRGLGLLHLGIQIELNQGKRVEQIVAKVN